MRIFPHTINQIVDATEGKREGALEKTINNISFDSRSLAINKQTLFIALKGKSTNGHKFIKHAYDKGCRAFLVSESGAEFEDATFIFVDDVIRALHRLAANHRQTLSIPVVGITGSYGKTTVKEWLYELIKDDFKVARSPKSYNSQLGVPLSILSIQDHHEVALIEAGISRAGEMERLQQIIHPTIGVFTGLGEAHKSNFSSDEQHLNEKMSLFKDVKALISLDDVENTRGIIDVPFTDEISIKNSLLACAIALKLGVTKEHVQNGAKQLKSLALRLELSEGKNGNIIINDSYSADENGFALALDFLKQKSEGKQTLVVSSKISETTKNLRHSFNIDDWVEIDDSLTSDILSQIESKRDTAILIKVEQGFFAQKVYTLLQKTNHTTCLEINLDSITNNYHVFKSLLRPETKVMLMLKAFGYGSGSIELSKHVQNLGADFIGVAYASEGEELRKSGVTLPIIVMSPEESSFGTMISNNLEPEIYSLELLDSFLRELINYGKTEYPIHIKIDTGMNRQGFYLNELNQLCQTINAQPEVRLASVFSHLAASDEESENDFTNQQFEQFEHANQIIEKELGQNHIKHILNTHGIINHVNHQYHMVRLGIGLFGEDFSGKLKNKLETVASFKTRLTQIKEVKKGETIGYGRETMLKEDKTIGILPVGYADGYFRALSNKAEVYINGQMAPVIGNVCMDITMVDLSNINAKVGDEVELFGEHILITDLAKKANTISYEILTSISSRVKRVYLSE